MIAKRFWVVVIILLSLRWVYLNEEKRQGRVSINMFPSYQNEKYFSKLLKWFFSQVAKMKNILPSCQNEDVTAGDRFWAQPCQKRFRLWPTENISAAQTFELDMSQVSATFLALVTFLRRWRVNRILWLVPGSRDALGRQLLHLYLYFHLYLYLCLHFLAAVMHSTVARCICNCVSICICTCVSICVCICWQSWCTWPLAAAPVASSDAPMPTMLKCISLSHKILNPTDSQGVQHRLYALLIF